ncbi:MAG: nucleoside hydrolase, partial [Naasia sp.]
SAYPDEAASLARIVAMTGAIGSGNATSSAEFNCWHDPEAVQVVLESGVPLTVFPLDSFDEASVPLAVAGEWADDDDPVLRMASAFLRHCTPPGADRSWLGDGAVACVAVTASLATVMTLPVEIDLAPGLSRGRMVTDRRGRRGEDEQHGGTGLRTSAAVVIAVDRDALAADYVRILEG